MYYFRTLSSYFKNVWGISLLVPSVKRGLSKILAPVVGGSSLTFHILLVDLH